MNPRRTSRFARTWAAARAVCLGLCILSVGGLARAEESGRRLREFLSVAGPSDSLQAIARHEDRIVAVGSKGLVLESADGGKAFERAQLPGRPPLIDLTVCSDGAFFLLDFRSGLWTRSAPDAPWTRRPIQNEPTNRPTGARLLDLQCGPDRGLWAVGEYSSVLRSDDGGVRWRRVFDDESDRLLTAIGFVGAGRVRVVGEFGTFLASDDGGTNWRAGPTVAGDLYPHAAAFASDGRSWVVGNTGAVFRLDPRAEEWVREDTSFSGAIYGVLRTEERMVAVGAGEFVGHREEREPPRWTQLATSPSRGVARDLRGLTRLADDSLLAVGSAGLVRLSARTDGARENR